MQNIKLVSNEQIQVIEKFNKLLQYCYDGSLKNFSDEFSIGDISFYERLKKALQRYEKSNMRQKTLDDFRKYIFFLEFKQMEKGLSFDKQLQKFDSRIEPLIFNFMIK